MKKEISKPNENDGGFAELADYLVNTPMKMPFTNSRYEYCYREFPFDVKFRPDIAYDYEMTKEGWNVAWKDIMMEGIFVVYRRSKVKV